MFGRRVKRYDEMITDPVFPYQVGRLVGAADMAAHLLAKMEDERSRDIGEKMRSTVGWFFLPTGDELVTLPREPPVLGADSPAGTTPRLVSE